MTRTRASATFAFASFFAAAAATGSLVMPAASADTLSNGLTVTCSQDSDIHATCIVGGCPRVNGDYVVDALHVLYDSDLDQSERDFKCINGQTARVGLDTPFQRGFGVQACRKKDLEVDWCTPFAHVNYAPPVKAAPQPPANVDPKPDPIIVKPPITCPTDSPTPTVPAGGTCAPVPIAPKNAVRVTFSRGLPSWTVNVTNSADIAGSCTYDASGGIGADLADRSFDIGPKGIASFSVPAPPLLQKYTTTTSCRGDFLGQNVEFGHDVQTVSQ